MNAPTAKSSFLAYKQRVLYSLFRAAARLGVRLAMPLDQMVELFRMAYFQEAREQQGLELEPISRLFGKSLRTVSSLHRRYRSDFFEPERDVQFRRELADRLARGPISREALAEQFDGAQLDAAIAELLVEGRIVETDGQFARNPNDHDFFEPANLNARVDGLNRQQDILSETVWQRLLTVDPPPSSVARSYVFAATDDDFQHLVDQLLDKLRHDCVAADIAAREIGQDNRRAITLATATLENE